MGVGVPGGQRGGRSLGHSPDVEQGLMGCTLKTAGAMNQRTHGLWKLARQEVILLACWHLDARTSELQSLRQKRLVNLQVFLHYSS